MQWLFARFEITPFNSLLVTFGLTVIIESLIQSIWTADFRRLESVVRAALSSSWAFSTFPRPSC
jgi:branched-subunit amino acid ABC-type transport system permease component